MTLLGPGLFPNGYSLNSLPDIQPFTIRSGETYSTMLESMRTWIQGTLVPYLNSVDDAYEDSVDDLIGQVEAALAAAVHSIATGTNVPLNDASIAAALATVNSASLGYLNTRYHLDKWGVNFLTPQMFGAKGDGTDDDTTAIDAMFGVADGKSCHFPPGQYVYNGVGANLYHSCVFGAGLQATQILLGANSYLLHNTVGAQTTQLENLTVIGGKGAIRQSVRTPTGSNRHVVRNVYFKNYTECAVSSNHDDQSNWNITGNIFEGYCDPNTFAVGTIGIALGDLHNGTLIENNDFRQDLVHVALRNGQDIKLRNNSYYQLHPKNGGGRIAVWVIPYGSTQNAHTGLAISEEKFGNENKVAGDFNVLIADEIDSTQEIGLSRPKMAASTGWVNSIRFDAMVYSTTGANLPVIYSFTPNLQRAHITFDDGFSTSPTYFVQYLNKPSTDTNIYTRRDAGITTPFTN